VREERRRVGLQLGEWSTSWLRWQTGAALDHLRAGGLSIAGFVDTARAWYRLNGLGTSPLYVDAGIGVRVHGPGPGGAIRIDIAHGLRGGGTTVSASWGGAGRR
jgi:hypothetical protein